MTDTFPERSRVALWSDAVSRMAWVSQSAPRIGWHDFLRNHFQPEPGEHTGIIGHTGSGKTHLQNSLLHKWPFVATFATKKNDITMERLISQRGYERFARWYPLSARDHPRRVIWPPASGLKNMVTVQKRVFEHAMDKIWDEGGRPKEHPVGWAVAMDEVWWFATQLGMREFIKIYLQQGRSNGISLIAASQRPAFIPTEIYSQSTHLFFFLETERKNLDRIGEINSRHAAGVKYIVNNLEPFQVLYVNTRTDTMFRTRAPFAA